MNFLELLKLFPIIAIASLVAHSESHAATKKVTATPEGITDS